MVLLYHSGTIQTVLSFRHDTSADNPPRHRTTQQNSQLSSSRTSKGSSFAHGLSAPPFKTRMSNSPMSGCRIDSVPSPRFMLGRAGTGSSCLTIMLEMDGAELGSRWRGGCGVLGWLCWELPSGFFLCSFLFLLGQASEFLFSSFFVPIISNREHRTKHTYL